MFGFQRSGHIFIDKKYLCITENTDNTRQNVCPAINQCKMNAPLCSAFYRHGFIGS